MMKKYCLLKESNTIEPCYYETGEPRNIYKANNGKWYLDHDVFNGFKISYVHDEIIAFGDTIEEIREKLKDETDKE